MKYLLYYRDGFIKKFPLNKPSVTIGRSSENDLVIPEEYISRKHMQIDTFDDSTVIRDLNSTNGIFVEGKKVAEAVIKLGDSFSVKGTRFVLRDGSLEEFKLTEELIPVFNKIERESEKKTDAVETKYVKNIFTELLKHILTVGLKKNSFNDFILEVPGYLNAIKEFGSLFLVSREGEEINVVLSVEKNECVLDQFKKIAVHSREIFKSGDRREQIPGEENQYFYSYPLALQGREAVFIYIPLNPGLEENEKVEEFLFSFIKEVTLLSQILEDGRRGGEKEEDLPFTSDEIVASSSLMKNLLGQARKIGQSNIYVLIQGESGTGKELFARLIHQHSSRRENQYVALNCAAIPESLLESELFGYEKGAFTGAYTQKKGKLELASDGTLVLDEIGDMPMGIQIKLLRVLQEQEFYRLSGNRPIKVDLRIISLTNSNLARLIREDKFREDLYYRLAHHTITIPPLRERKEEIAALVTFFTKKHCKCLNKEIRGYSIKAFETMQKYHWPGNVRQLENEINRLINLVDDGGTVDYELLSERIKSDGADFGEVPTPSPFPVIRGSEKEYLCGLLEKNNWNKSKTARDLNMTYQGLHKKLKKLGIEKPLRKKST